ncbi:MAG: amino acid ABC transporter substrate-binding protein [Anaerolineae bacterium]|nr:amino acid ABC transporter substrate-binding protein [Anaerolineae bacterium]
MLLLLGGGCGRRAAALERVREAGVLRVAMDPSFPPFESVDEGGAVVGCDVDLARELARRLGVQAHFVATTYDGLYDILTVEGADVTISALYPDPTRTQDFVFSRSYFEAGQVLVVPPDSTITAVADLAGQRVLVVFGTEGHMEALRWEELLSPPPTLVPREGVAEVLAALEAGEAGAAVVDNLAAQTALARGAALQVLDPPVSHEPYVIVARSQDGDLLDELDKFLEEMSDDGTLATLVARWVQ